MPRQGQRRWHNEYLPHSPCAQTFNATLNWTTCPPLPGASNDTNTGLVLSQEALHAVHCVPAKASCCLPAPQPGGAHPCKADRAGAPQHRPADASMQVHRPEHTHHNSDNLWHIKVLTRKVRSKIPT